MQDTTLARRLLLVMIILGLWLSAPAGPVQARKEKVKPMVNEQQLLSRPETIPGLIADQVLDIDQVPNPHWRADACQACHAGKPTAVELKLRNRDIDQLCNTCHAVLHQLADIHPVGTVPSRRMLKRMPRTMRSAVARGGGKVSCITCHDLPLQCHVDQFYKAKVNPGFFRDWPYSSRTDLCYRCHDDATHKRLNPHKHITKSGKLRESLCHVCHSSTKGLQTAKGIEDVQFNVGDDLSAMCTGCHPWIPHPGGGGALFGKKGPDHLVVPSKDVLRQMKKMGQKNNVIFPLDSRTGRVFCATCHNPHAKGVMHSEIAAKGAGAPKRLRIQEKEICKQCHAM